jgi:hypothetical protein
MAVLAELFPSEIIKKPVFDPNREITGRAKDVIAGKGAPLPEIWAFIVQRKGQVHLMQWAAINIFNKRIISSFLYAASLATYCCDENDLLGARHS